ncbi:MAG: Crp/Fnr family transcriptional regulator [Sediminibacterium sp.]
MYLKKGEVLFSEGGRSQGVFCVSEGKIKMSHMGDDGKDQIIRLVKAGDIFGYVFVFVSKDLSGYLPS